MNEISDKERAHRYKQLYNSELALRMDLETEVDFLNNLINKQGYSNQHGLSIFLLSEHTHSGDAILSVYEDKEEAIKEAKRLRALHGLFFYVTEKLVIKAKTA